jgi:phosphoribosylformylglycinamidine synthase
MNKNRQFSCKDVNLKVENGQSVFTHLCDVEEILTIPIAHSEGNYYCSAEDLSQLKENNQIVFRYSTPDGKITSEANPNGSIENIAGIMNITGNVLGMMPHPERNAEPLLGNSDGKKILSSILESFKGN